MRSSSLLYHDVLPDGVPLEQSGFRGPARYKLRVSSFNEHLSSIIKIGSSASRVIELVATEPPPLFLTFDDGGRSCFEVIAPALEEKGWYGHFFIATKFINQPGFMTNRQIAELQEKGHVIGSHSASHPLRMSSLSDGELQEEWEESVRILTELLGRAITVASVPGGGYSKRVAMTAARAGIKVLFTSEPVSQSKCIDGCQILGRYSILDDTSAETAAELAGLETLPRLRQFMWWNAKKVMKIALGRHYLSLRESLLARSDTY